MALKVLKSQAALGFVSVLIAVAFSAFTSSYLPIARIAENSLHDFAYVVGYPKAAKSEDIVILAITEETLAGFDYRSPIDRAFLANLLEILSKHGPAGIALDILFDHPTEEEKDALFFRSLVKERAFPIVAAYPDERIELTEAQSEFLNGVLPADQRSLAVLLIDPDDGVVRSSRNRANEEGRIVESMAHRLAGQSAGEDDSLIAYQFADDLNEPPFSIYPAHIASVLPAEWFEGKYILIGAILPQTDRYPTPLNVVLGAGKEMPGVLIHAHKLRQLLDQRYLQSVDEVMNTAITFLMAAVMGLIFSLKISVVFRTVAGISLCLLYFACVLFAIRSMATILPVYAPVSAAVLAAVLIGGLQWRAERSQRRFIRGAFSRYVSPVVVNELIARPEQLHRRPVRRAATCVFTDVAGFTSMTERHKDRPEKVEVMLNAYLSGMSQIFLDHGATLDKFIGDAVVGFFGGPIVREDHAAAALRMVRDLDRFAEAFSKDQDHGGNGFGQTRIGVHSGEVLLGNFGGDAFFDYTAIGDVVNTAARLESANKYFGTRVCASSGTIAGSENACPHRPIGKVILKGKSEPLVVYELLTAETDAESLERYLMAYECMCSDPQRALQLFQALLAETPEDALSKFHLGRLSRGDVGDQFELESK